MKHLTILFAIISININAQDTQPLCLESLDSLSGIKIFHNVDSLAVPQIGNHAFFKLITNTIQISGPKEGDIKSGRVYLGFIVDENGFVSDFHTYKDPYPSQNIPNQLERIIKSIKWQPAICNGNAVKSRYYLPFFACLSR